MAVTKSNKSNITSPNGNSLAMFVDINDDKLKMKDINGEVQPLDDFVSVSEGTLQIENGLPIDATLQNVVDQNGNLSQLQLATNDTRVTGTLEVNDTTKIKTTTETYLDIEDGSGNNRFTISKGTGSQKVTLDYASNPTSGLEIVGSIRTYQDGTNLIDVVTFRKDGLVGVLYGLNLGGSELQNFSANLETLAANTIFDASNTATFNGSVTKVSGARTFTFDNALPLGFTMTIIQTDANQTTFVGAGAAVINNRQSQNKNNGRYSVVSIVKIDNNSFVLGGDTSA
jgi:hypothetical protein